MMRRAVCICVAALMISVCGCSRQDVRHALDKLTARSDQSAESSTPAVETKATKPVIHGKKAEPEPEPTQQELAEYLRGKLLALSPSDGVNDNIEVSFNSATSVLTVFQPDNHCDHFFSALDTNNFSWEIFDPSDAHISREELLRLTVTSVSGKTARACFDKQGQPEEGTSTNRMRLLFSLAKSEQVPGFQAKMAKAVKKLIILSGGAEEKELFPDAKGKSGSAKK
jgi:hypothetical protein